MVSFVLSCLEVMLRRLGIANCYFFEFIVYTPFKVFFPFKSYLYRISLFQPTYYFNLSHEKVFQFVMVCLLTIVSSVVLADYHTDYFALLVSKLT